MLYVVYKILIMFWQMIIWIVKVYWLSDFLKLINILTK